MFCVQEPCLKLKAIQWLINAILTEFNLIQKVAVCVHDNATNMERAGEISPE